MINYKPVLGWEDRYLAGDDGSIVGIKKSRRTLYQQLWEVNNSKRYIVKLWRDGKVKTKAVQVLICEAWHGKRPKGYEVSHLNGDSLDNRADNLAWETRKQNQARRLIHGTHDRGVANSRAKFNVETLAKVRQQIKSQIPYGIIAKEFHCAKSTISRINTGKRYFSLDNQTRKS